jgi:hypothetical protein
MVHYENEGTTSKLELNIELPNTAAADARVAAS